MPKKTRREKMSAQQRRKDHAFSSGPTASYTFSPRSTNHSPSPAIPVLVPVHTSDYGPVKADLIRISLFTFLAFVANGVLYFLTHRG